MALHRIMPENKKNIIVVLICYIVAVFCVGHYDANAIVTWGIELLRSVRINQISLYAIKLIDIGMPTNYGLFVNSLTAIVESPVYLFEIMGFPVPLVVYITWYKMILCVVVGVIYKELHWILDSENRCDPCVLSMFLGSILVVFYAVAMGQVDLFAILFMVLSVRMLLQEKWFKMALCMAMSTMIKAFPILAYAPIFIFLLGKFQKEHRIREFVRTVILFVVPLVLERIIALYGIPEYFTYAELVNQNNFIPKVLVIKLAGVPVVPVSILLVGIFYLWYVIKTEEIKKEDLLLCINFVYFIFFSMVEWSPQYLLYGMIFLLITWNYVIPNRNSTIVFGVWESGILLTCLGHFNDSLFNAMLISNSLLGKCLHMQKEVYLGNLLPTYVGVGCYVFGRFMVTGVFAYTVLEQYRSIKMNRTKDDIPKQKTLLNGFAISIGYMCILFIVTLVEEMG